MEEEDEALVAASYDLAKDLLTDPEWRPFLDAVVYCANIVDNELEAAAKGLEKN